MAQVSRRTAFTGSTLTRLLARLADIDVSESRHAFADRLSQWLGWTDAISLSGVLNGSPAVASAGAGAARASSEQDECVRLRGVLAKAIADDGSLAAQKEQPGTATDFAPYRRRYVARQQTMEMAIGPLRERLRASLAARSPAMAQLAAVDAVMEQALGAQEYRLLSTVPGLLEKHFRRLRQAHQAVPSEPEGGAPQVAWQDMFRKDMQAVLLAELELRLQPVEGLLEALRKSS
ncbi:hypothetical protein H6CHR_03842 [Variovorax sp. PBL-H6]|uniref:DUF3348 domain-containing protein n=1 Tax=Variovorax sp. PBL-H6 TaxID=434009 RepID=UPI001316E6EE|nr:DUF3348 domain-containing protein [Variovorax sp. PBL-H6]VTU32647.1 hypothetical protein H6CHR_03842 [Variovorax sp. PBL-H6]